MKKEFAEGRGYTRADWDEVSDNPDTSPEDMAKATTFAEVFPELAASARRAIAREARSRKTLISLRLTPEVIERFKAGGPGWQTRIEEALRKVVGL